MSDFMQNFDSRPRFWQLLKNWLCARFRIDPKTFWDFPPEMPFFQLHSVRSSLTYIPSIFLILVLLITCCSWSQLRVDLSFEGFNYYFFHVLKFPLAFLALLIPLIAIFAANHRSVQAKETMRLTREQNVFANYYKHREEFFKYTKDLGLLAKFSPVRMHNVLYGKAMQGDMGLNIEFLEYIRLGVDRLNGFLIDAWSPAAPITSNSFIREFSIYIKEITQKIGLSLPDLDPSTDYFLRLVPCESVEVVDNENRGNGGRDELIYLDFINRVIQVIISVDRIISFSPDEMVSTLNSDIEKLKIIIEDTNEDPKGGFYNLKGWYLE